MYPIIATSSSMVYFWVFGQWLNIPLERIAYWPGCTVDYWSLYIDIKVEIEWKHKCHFAYSHSFNGHELTDFCLAPKNL